jgi:FkbM family methyltransferase
VDSGLVFDLGMHHGEDTAYYLSRGFRVVGVEANPANVAHLQDRFASEIADGRVTVVPRAIAAQRGRVTFTAVAGRTIWGSIDEGFVQRARRDGLKTTTVEVDAVSLGEVLDEHGTPYYLKVDVEGMDLTCVAALRGRTDLPRFLSVESVVTSLDATPAMARAELALVRDLGYSRFAYVDQATLGRLTGTRLEAEGAPVTYEHAEDSSGPFGDDLPAAWRPYRAALTVATALNGYHWIFGNLGRRRPLPMRVVGGAARRLAPKSNTWWGRWFDLHARLDGPVRVERKT